MTRRSRRMTTVVVLILLALPLTLAVQAWQTRRQSAQMPRTARDALTPCDETPNCVSSLNQGERGIAPLDLKPAQADHPRQAWEQLVNLLESRPRTKIVVNDGRYLRAEVRTPLFGFVDDLEFLLKADEQRIDVRSASRAGYSDLGANRRRVDEIRKQWRESSTDR